MAKKFLQTSMVIILMSGFLVENSKATQYCCCDSLDPGNPHCIRGDATMCSTEPGHPYPFIFQALVPGLLAMPCQSLTPTGNCEKESSNAATNPKKACCHKVVRDTWGDPKPECI